MKLFQLAIATLMISGFGSAAADSVNPANVTTFQSGSPALASEVNSTIQALITAIDDNATRIAALEADAASLVPPSVEGSTYCMFSLSTGVGAGDDQDPDPAIQNGLWMGAASGASTNTLTFTSSTQVTISSPGDTFYEALAPSNFLVDQSDGPGTETVTWTQSGNTVTLTFGVGDEASFMLSADGNIMISNDTELDRSGDNSGDWFSADLNVAVRAASCN